jgi:hypothetical protein
MGQVKGHGLGRVPHIQHGDRTLQLVVSCLMEEIAESDHTAGFTGEVQSQARRAASEQTGDRVQLLAAVMQVISGYKEVGRAKCEAGRKEQAVLAVPKPMAGRFRQCCGLRRGRDR